jgi:hypothetical protein
MNKDNVLRCRPVVTALLEPGPGRAMRTVKLGPTFPHTAKEEPSELRLGAIRDARVPYLLRSFEQSGFLSGTIMPFN